MTKPTIKITQGCDGYWLSLFTESWGPVSIPLKFDDDDIGRRAGILREVKGLTFVPEPGGEAGGVEGAFLAPFQPTTNPGREGGSTPLSGSMTEIRSRMAQLLIGLERIKRHLVFDDYEALRGVLADYAYLVAENAKLRTRLAEKPKVTKEQITQLEAGIDNIDRAGQSYLGVRDDIINCILTILGLEVED